MKASNRFLYAASLLAISSFLSSGYAKTIDMYEQPNISSKKVASVDLADGVMPIFTPKGSDWVKIADPQNGNVGWVKSSDLSNGPVTSFSFTQKMSGGEGKSDSYQVFQFGNTPAVMTEQTKQQLQKMQSQQLINQKAVQNSIQNMVNDINSIYKQQINMMNDMEYPIVMPVVIIPAQQTMVKPATTPVKSKTQTTHTKK